MIFFIALELFFLVFTGVIAPGSAASSPADEIGAWATEVTATLPAARDGRAYALPPAPDREIRSAAPRRRNSDDLGVVVAAKSAAVVDLSSDALLFEKDSERVHSIASLTKLMTALVVRDRAPDWSQRIVIEAGDHRGGGVEYFISGESVTVKDLFYAMLVASSNTAAVALARSTGLSEEQFVTRMNEQATTLGLRSARFTEPSGLDAGNRASARDVAVLSRAAFSNGDIRSAVRTDRYELVPLRPRGAKRRVLRSTDLLLGGMLNHDPYAISGGKTGTLGDLTGYHLAIAVSSIDIKKEILVVVLGSETHQSRFEDAKTLAYWTFEAHEWSPRIPVADARRFRNKGGLIE